MSRLIVIEFVSLDGVMHDPDGSDGSPQGGWAFRYGREAVTSASAPASAPSSSGSTASAPASSSSSSASSASSAPAAPSA